MIDGNSEMLQCAAESSWRGQGTKGDPVIIQGYILKGSAHLFQIINTDLYFEFRDSYLDGVDGQWCSIYLNNVTHASFVNVNITHGAIGMHLVSIAESSIKSCSIHDCSSYGIALELTCVDNAVANNTISRNAMDGIVLDLTSTRNLIEYNHLSLNRQSGVQLWSDSYANTVRYNLIEDNRVSGLNLRGHSNMIVENLIRGSIGSGVFVKSSGNNISRNLIADCGTSGITLKDGAHSNVLARNTVYNCSDYGLKLEGDTSDNSVALNNFILNGLGTQALDDGKCNLVEENYWSPWNCCDEDNDSFADQPYILGGLANNSDSKPLFHIIGLVPDWVNFTENSQDVACETSRTADCQVSLHFWLWIVAMSAVFFLTIMLVKMKRR
jgi:parallel beta-helix repeat protein